MFEPATSDAFTQPYTGRTTANWIAFLTQVDAWLPAHAERIYAILDNLSTHRAVDMLLYVWRIHAGSSSSSPPTPPT